MAQEPIYNQTESSMAWDDLRTSPAFPAILGGVAGAGSQKETDGEGESLSEHRAGDSLECPDAGLDLAGS